MGDMGDDTEMKYLDNIEWNQDNAREVKKDIFFYQNINFGCGTNVMKLNI